MNNQHDDLIGEAQAQQPVIHPRNFQIPGCSVGISSDEDGVTVEELLSLIFSLAHSNPGAIVDFGITVRNRPSEVMPTQEDFSY